MNKVKEEKGITLVALVITVIVLIILAGVTIDSLLGEHGIITKAKEASRNMVDASRREEELMDNLLNELLKVENGEDITNPDKADYCNLKINMQLESYNTTLGEFPIIFQVTATSNQEIIYNDTVEMQMDETGKKTIELEKVGPEGSNVNVKVVYAGINYNLTTSKDTSVTLSKSTTAEVNYKERYSRRSF